METLRISSDEKKELISGREGPPKYTYYALNNAVKYSGANKKSKIGDLQQIYQEFQEENTGNEFSDWKEFYYKRHDGDERINQAVDDVYEMFIQIREAIKQIDRDDVRDFVEGIALYGTYESENPETAVEEKLLREVPECERINPESVQYGGTPIEIVEYGNEPTERESFVIIRYEVEEDGDIVVDLSGFNRQLNEFA